MKIIFLDYGVFMHRAIFAWKNNKAVPPTYTALSMMIANLKRVGPSPEDLIIVAIDSPKGSWRREIDSNYKSNRKEKREAHDIDWKHMFRIFDDLKKKLQTTTPFHLIEIDSLEADDIIGYGVRYFQAHPCIVVSTDTDFEQLATLPNVRLFSPLTKHYKLVEKPEFTISKKIMKETTDNLITPINGEADYLKRLMLVDLIHLPPMVEEQVQYALGKITQDKPFDLAALPFKGIRSKFMEIYNSDIIVAEDDYGKPKQKRRKKT